MCFPPRENENPNPRARPQAFIIENISQNGDLRVDNLYRKLIIRK